MSTTPARRYDCDGCGAVAYVDGCGGTPAMGDVPDGWRCVYSVRHVCPACVPLAEAHERAVADWFAARDAIARPAYERANAAYAAETAPLREWEAAHPRPAWGGGAAELARLRDAVEARSSWPTPEASEIVGEVRERAAVVAWLRRVCDGADIVADAIEAGDHRETP